MNKRCLRRWRPAALLFALGAMSLPGSAVADIVCTPVPGEPQALTVQTERLRVVVDKGVIVEVQNLVTGKLHADRTRGQGGSIPRGLERATGQGTRCVPWSGTPCSVTNSPPCTDPSSQWCVGALAEAAFLHSPWGSYEPSRSEYPSFHHPRSGSGFELTPPGPPSFSSCAATWQCLTNKAATSQCDPADPGTFPNESLKLTFTNDGGELVISADGVSLVDGGVLGVTVPITNIGHEHRIYVPSFGGVMYDAATTTAGIFTLDKAPYWEAPVVAIESDAGSIGMWIEDPTYKPNMFLLSRTDSATPTFGLAIQQFNLALGNQPNAFDSYTEIHAVAWHLDAVSGRWPEAMTPYKNWYAQQYSTELSRRAAETWPYPGPAGGPGDIRVMLDQWQAPGFVLIDDLGQAPQCSPSYSDTAYLSEMAGLFQPGTTLLFEADARSASFDTELPEWQPRKDCIQNATGLIRKARCQSNADCLAGETCSSPFPAVNTTLRNAGFRTMGYVNTYVVNPVLNCWGFCPTSTPPAPGLDYACPMYQHISACSRDSKLRWLFDAFQFYPDPATSPYRRTFASATSPTDLIFSDPLSPWWREYHVDQMGFWKGALQFDSNYEDTGGLVGDMGNGTIGGLSAAEGAVQLFRDLQLDPGVPLSTEYGADAVAFASRWPLRGAQGVGTPATREWLVAHQRPVSTFLFGPDQAAWVRTASSSARDNFGRWVVAGSSDALGGVAQFQAGRFTYKSTRGDIGAQKSRAQLFSSLKLKPDFRIPWQSTWGSTQTLVALYKSASGSYYEYHVSADGREHKMLRPDGSPEYARVTGMNRYTSTLVPNGWPAFGGGQVFGLNPDARYNVGGGIYTPAKIRVTALTNDVKITRYYETPTHIVMNLESAGASSATFTWQTNGVTVYKTLRNGVGTSSPGSTPKNVIAALPSRYVLITVPLNQVDAPVFSDPDFGSTMTRQLGNRCTDSGRFIEEETGIDRGGELPAVHRDTHWWWANPDPLISNLSTLMPAWGENAPQTFDYLAKVPTPSTPALKHTVLQVFTCHVCGDTSDLVVHLNGQEVARLSGTAVCDPGPVSTCGTQSCASTDPCPSCAVPGSGDCSPGAVMCHPCIPPGRYELDMTAYHGKEVVISVSMDHGSDNNPDGDGRWISRPRFAEATNSQ